MRRYGLGDIYNKRVPSMYFFYRDELRSAYSMDDVKRVEYLIKDLPKDIYLALVREGEIETSIDTARKQIHLDPEEIVRATLIMLERGDWLNSWPSDSDVEYVTSGVLEIIAEDINGETQ